MLVARKSVGLELTAAEIREINPNVAILTYSLDISNEDAVRALFAKIKSEFGTIDVLINNAGVGNSASIRDIDPKDFWRDFVCEIRPRKTRC